MCPNIYLCYYVRVKVKRKFLFLGLKWMISGKLKNAPFGRNSFSTNIIWATYMSKAMQFLLKTFMNWIEELEKWLSQWYHIGNVCNFHRVSWTRPQLSSWVLLLDRDLSVSSKVRVVKIGEKKLVLGNSLVTTLIFVFLKLSVKPLGMRSSFVWVSSFILNWSTLCVLHVYFAII